MTLFHLLSPMPKWYIADNSGNPLGAGYMRTLSHLNKSDEKAVYQDNQGSIPWENPIVFDANGSEGPFYWEVNDEDLSDTYYLEVYDRNNNLVFTIDDFFPPGEGGGGGGTTYIDLKNYIGNNVFWRNLGTYASPVPNGTVIAPGNHIGFHLPDITMFKEATNNAVDTIEFVNFPIGPGPLAGDITPIQYLKYSVGITPTIDTQRAINFPVDAKVNNLNGQDVTFTFWGRVITGNPNITIFEYQYFGTGGSPTAPNRNAVGSALLTADWQKFDISFNFTSTATATLGGNGDDALYVQIGFPLVATTEIHITKPSLYLGTISPGADFDTYDQIDSIINTPRTGDIRLALNTFSQTNMFGWVPMNDGTIGNNVVALGSSNATTRANSDTFFLYSTIWSNISESSGYAPIYDSSGNPTTRGASAAEDFYALKALSLTRALGRVFGGTYTTVSLTFTVTVVTSLFTISSTNSFLTGKAVRLTTTGTLPSPLQLNITYYTIRVDATTFRIAQNYTDSILGVFILLIDAGTGTHTISTPPFALGQPTGDELHTLTVAELASHNHTATISPEIRIAGESGVATSLGNFEQTYVVPAVTVASTGSSTPFTIVQPSIFYNVYMKL